MVATATDDDSTPADFKTVRDVNTTEGEHHQYTAVKSNEHVAV